MVLTAFESGMFICLVMGDQNFSRIGVDDPERDNRITRQGLMRRLCEVDRKATRARLKHTIHYGRFMGSIWDLEGILGPTCLDN